MRQFACNSKACDSEKFIVIDGGFSDGDDIEFECCKCDKTWIERDYGNEILW